MSISDILTKTIPVIEIILMNILVMFIFALRLYRQETTIVEGMISTIPGLILCLLSYTFPKDIGIGDGIVMIIVGIGKGFSLCCLILIISCICIFIITCVYLLISWINGRNPQKMPMIPFITIGAFGVEMLI